MEVAVDPGGRSPIDLFESGQLDYTQIGQYDAAWAKFDRLLGPELRQTPDRAEQQKITKRIVDREFDQAYRLWMPYDNGFMMFQPHVRNAASLALRRTDGYGSPAIARLWLDK